MLKWFVLSIVLPIAGPIIVALLCILLWWTQNPQKVPNYSVALELTPSALTFYGIVLIASTLIDFWPKVGQHALPALAAILVAGVLVANYAILAVSKQNSGYVPTDQAVFAALILGGATIAICTICKRIELKDV